MSFSAKRRAKKLGVSFEFIFMRGDGNQLSKITDLIESGKIRPVLDKIFPFEQTNEALAYIESGRAKGKIVIKVR